jgi:quercetin dioxygenase-like cupin family protein
VKAGEVYENRVQRDRAVVREGSAENGGERLVVALQVAPGGGGADKHVHSYLTETFEVLSGTVRLHLDGQDEIAVADGTRFEARPGTVHGWWNASDTEPASVLVEVTPGERFELMIQTLYGLANDGRTDARGIPRPLPLALFAREFRPEVELVRPPRIVQRILFALVAPLARARGDRAIYPEYLGPDGKAAAVGTHAERSSV